jgi:hypothetical protein
MTGQICHVAAKSADGPRYDPDMSDEERDGFDNLLLLCGEHHTTIDRHPERYESSWLLTLKAEHERRAIKQIELSDEVATGIASALIAQLLGDGRVEYRWEKTGHAPLLGSATRRRRVRGAGAVLGACALLTWVGACWYQVRTFGMLGAPEWVSRILIASTFAFGLAILARVYTNGWRPDTYRRMGASDVFVDGDGNGHFIGVWAACGECGEYGGVLSLHLSPAHPTEHVLGQCSRNPSHVFTFDPSTLKGRRTFLPKPRPEEIVRSAV